MSDIPRRAQLEKMVPAERAIYDAMGAVEEMPADERLTRAVILLGEARSSVADYVDGVEKTSARSGRSLHDGQITHPAGGCPRGLPCMPLARYASEGFQSYMCCGDNGGDASVPTDVFRLCIKSTHQMQPADVLVNLDELDVTHTAAVLMGALASNAAIKGNPMEAVAYAPQGERP